MLYYGCYKNNASNNTVLGYAFASRHPSNSGRHSSLGYRSFRHESLDRGLVALFRQRVHLGGYLQLSGLIVEILHQEEDILIETICS